MGQNNTEKKDDLLYLIQPWLILINWNMEEL